MGPVHSACILNSAPTTYSSRPHYSSDISFTMAVLQMVLFTIMFTSVTINAQTYDKETGLPSDCHDGGVWGSNLGGTRNLETIEECLQACKDKAKCESIMFKQSKQQCRLKKRTMDSSDVDRHSNRGWTYCPNIYNSMPEECIGHICYNGGSCNPATGECYCPEPFTGPTCEEEGDACVMAKCSSVQPAFATCGHIELPSGDVSIELDTEYSDSVCELNVSFGIDDNIVVGTNTLWLDHGCKGIFKVCPV